MMTNHESGKRTVQEIAKRPAWYIEVVAVDPSYQRRSLGSQMLKHLVGLCPPGEPIYLECTDENNVPFYEKYGFKVVKTSHLIDPMVESDEGVKLWLMAKF